MSLPKDPARNPLLGKWEYVDCTIKNTSVAGTVEFFPDGSFLFDGQIHEDFPTRPFRRKYLYEVRGRRLVCLTKDHPALEYPPVSPFFLIEDDSLFFLGGEIKSAEDDWSGPYRKTNWIYKLVRKKMAGVGVK